MTGRATTIWAASYSSFSRGRFVIPDTQYCPICSKPVEPSQRYPHYVCGQCTRTASSKDGRDLKFYTESYSGGFSVKYSDTGETYLSHDCYINDVKCYADEAYFGGIVIEVVTNLSSAYSHGFGGEMCHTNQFTVDIINFEIKSLI
jgi:hypothetical protein